MADNRLIIIDSSSLLYRAFHALPPLDYKGQPTGAVYGFLLTLFKAIKDVKATHIIACFDTPKPTFRHAQFDDYKAHRLPPPDALISQFGLLKDVLLSLSIPMFEKEGFEADDLIATIATQVSHQGGTEIFIVSGDLDNLQIVGQNIKLYTLGKSIKEGIIYDRAKVVERFGIEPAQMNDFKALKGDASDNIPGVPGIGEKTAAELIQKYGSVKNLYDELATDTAVVKPKIKEALITNKDKAFLSFQLVQADRNVAVNIDFDSSRFGNFDKQTVEKTFIGLGFNSLISRLEEIVF